MPELQNRPSLGKRSNRYLNAKPIRETYPEGLVLACKTRAEAKCGSLKGFYAPKDKVGNLKPYFHRCGKLRCSCCGTHQAYKAGMNASQRILGLAKTVEWYNIRFASFNIDLRLEKFQFRPDESTKKWLKRVETIVKSDAIEAGLEGFAMTFHSDRLCFENGNEVRKFNPHFHVIGMGYLIDSEIFYKKYGYTYSAQQSIHKYVYSDVKELASRVSYRLNHSTSLLSETGRASDCIKYYGTMSYRNLKTNREVILKEYVLNENDEKYVRVNIPIEEVSSDQPKRVLDEINFQEHANESYIKDQSRIETEVYLPIVMERRLGYLKRLRYEQGLEITDDWRNRPLDIKYYEKGNEKREVYLYETERITEFINRNGRKSVVSSFEFVKGKRPHLEELMEQEIASIKNRYEEKRKKRKKKKSLNISISI